MGRTWAKASSVHPKVAAGGAIGTPLGVVLVWVLGQFGVEMPAEVAAALGTVVGAVVGWFKKGKEA